jgi:predicted GNAT superfamily acetyltransferase
LEEGEGVEMIKPVISYAAFKAFFKKVRPYIRAYDVGLHGDIELRVVHIWWMNLELKRELENTVFAIPKMTVYMGKIWNADDDETHYCIYVDDVVFNTMSELKRMLDT